MTQTQKFIGGQQIATFEGVFPQAEAEEAFMNLVTNAHVETVEAPKDGKIVVTIQNEEDEVVLVR